MAATGQVAGEPEKVPRTTGTFGTFWHFYEGSSVPSRRARPIQERAFREMARPMCPYRNSLFSNVLRRRPRPSASHSPARGSDASGRPRSVALAWHYCEGVPSPAPMSWSSAPGHSLDGQEWTCGHCIGPDGGMAHSSHNAADSRTVIDMPYFCLLSLLFELSVTPGHRDNSNKGYRGDGSSQPPTSKHG